MGSSVEKDMFRIPSNPDIRQVSYAFVNKEKVVPAEKRAEVIERVALADQHESATVKGVEALCMRVHTNGDQIKSLRQTTGIELSGELKGGPNRYNGSVEDFSDTDISDIANEISLKLEYLESA